MPDFFPSIPKSVLILSILFLTACGGGSGGSGSSSDTNATNTKPVADAGPDLTILIGADIKLDGSGSFDSDNDTLSFSWTIDSAPTGSSTTIAGNRTISPSITPDIVGAYAIGLVVNDGTNDSAKNTILISVIPQNRAPTANAGPNRSVVVGSTAILNGSNSSDPDGDKLSYLWAVDSRPSTSSAGLIAGTTSSPSFTPDVSGSYTLSLIVNDGKVSSAPDTIVITGSATSNIAPVANAGSDQAVFVGTLVNLIGAGSSDADGDTLSFEWSGISPATSTASFSNSRAVNPTFIPDVPGTYSISLVVNDGLTNSLPDTVEIVALSIPTLNNIVVFSGDTYLGCWSCNQFDSESIHNSFSQYGSAFGSLSIRNDFSQYGSAFSSLSACNRFATDPPSLIDNNFYYGKLSINQFNSDSICNNVSIFFSGPDCTLLQSYCAN